MSSKTHKRSPTHICRKALALVYTAASYYRSLTNTQSRCSVLKCCGAVQKLCLKLHVKVNVSGISVN